MSGATRQSPPVDRQPPRRAGRGALRIWVVTMLAVGVALTLPFAAGSPAGLDGYEQWHDLVLVAITNTTLGAVIVSRRPRHPIGWLLLVGSGVLTAVQLLAGEYAGLGPDVAPFAPLAAWVAMQVQFTGVLAVVLVFQLFPTGRPLAPRWRILVWATIVGLACQFIASGLAPGSIRFMPSYENPFGVARAEPALDALATAAAILVGAGIVGGLVSLGLRLHFEMGLLPYAEQFVLKGGMLLAAYNARRPTADVDALARHLANDQDAVVAWITEVAGQPVDDDGVKFLTDTAVARPIREDAFYPGMRVAMDSRIATAAVRFRLDVNFGDPVTPAPRMIELPSLRSDAALVRVLSDRDVLAEKLATAILLGEANSRVRDYADIYTLTGRHDLIHSAVHAALNATAGFRGVEIAPLSSVVDDLVELCASTYRAYRAALGPDGATLPADFGEVVDAVTTFADPLADLTGDLRWHAAEHRWIAAT